ncbi:DUF3748 domain-containing protein [Algoriphagus lacus]|uniref:DUF3748 domain-containing protein n=2 Tax=Algoriphagus lacus TaxID=2056311 RepID=A0A418PUH6_9BACT|nr:DUF3748 domain-containing protein [Algoriphagus lacus]
MLNFLRQSGLIFSFSSLMGFGLIPYSPQLNDPMNTLVINPNPVERQLTFGSQGYFLNHRQAFSPNDEWLAFDGRKEDSKMGENDLIGLVNIHSGQILEVYRVPKQQAFGPGSGAVSYHPHREEVVFIRGLLSADAENPYYFTRRSAMGLNLENKQAPELFHLDARDVTPPFTPGALRGGSHAYSYSQDGNWVSFTYNDDVMEKAAATNPQLKDLRTVAFMVRGKKVEVQAEPGREGDEFSGSHFAVLAAEVVPFPKPGSDEIQKACEETWVGHDGYVNAQGEKIPRALAYLGDVVTAEGKVVTEVFVTDIPEDWDKNLKDQNLGGTEVSFPEMPKSFTQRRITFTSDRKYPGVQGPRHWLKSSKNGDRIFFYAKSDDGIVQIFKVSPNGGQQVQITRNEFSPDTAFSLSPDDCWIAFGYQNQLYLTEVATGKTQKVGPTPPKGQSELCNINWSHSGRILAYNRKVDSGNGAYFQVFLLEVF